jgi:hypothetical protein
MKKAKTRSLSSSSNHISKPLKTEQTLSNGICQNAFFNILRSGNSGHAETKMTFVPIKVNQRKVPISHIFTGEDPSTIKVTRKSAIKYTPSNVMFNDNYFEKNPKINPLKKKKYEMEKKWKDSKQPYSDELILTKSKKDILKRRIDENYKTNPLKQNTKEENIKMNQELALKSQRHTQAYNGFLGSKNCSRILGGIHSPRLENRIKFEEQKYNNKITDNNFNINKRAMDLNKNKDNEVPYYGNKNFRHVNCGTKSFTFA